MERGLLGTVTGNKVRVLRLRKATVNLVLSHLSLTSSQRRTVMMTKVTMERICRMRVEVMTRI